MEVRERRCVRVESYWAFMVEMRYRVYFCLYSSSVMSRLKMFLALF